MSQPPTFLSKTLNSTPSGNQRSAADGSSATSKTPLQAAPSSPLQGRFSAFPRTESTPAPAAPPANGLRPPLSSALAQPGKTVSARATAGADTPSQPSRFAPARPPSPSLLGEKTPASPFVKATVPQSPFSRPQQAAPSPLRTPLTPSAAFRSQTSGAAPQATSPFRKELHVSDEEFIQLRDFIYKQCGIFIAENRKYLVENRLSNRIKALNLKSYHEYYNYLRYDTSRGTELNKLFEVVTTNETSFFRNPPQLEIFQKSVMPGILDKCRSAGRKKLRIWSAGCSTGEEPYTLAIILHELLKGEIAGWDIKITANDLSEAVLAAAQRGVYNEYTLRTTPKNLVETYFLKDGQQYKILPEVKRLVSFGQINLNDKAQLQRVEKSQIVFCRNVIIYFDDEMKRKVISTFYDNLEVNGALLIGHSESLHNISRAFHMEHHKGTIVYRKLG